MEGKTDAHVLDGSPVTVSFAGREYVWRQKPRREQRKIRNRLADIAGLVVRVSQADTGGQLAHSVECVNEIIEFCEDNHPEMSDDMDSIESHIRKTGMIGVQELISGVYNPLFEAWLKPWLSGDDDEPAQKKRI